MQLIISKYPDYTGFWEAIILRTFKPTNFLLDQKLSILHEIKWKILKINDPTSNNLPFILETQDKIIPNP